MMSGASIVAGKSLSRGGSVVIAAGRLCACAFAAMAKAKSIAKPAIVGIWRSSLGWFMARHCVGFRLFAHRKSFAAFGITVCVEPDARRFRGFSCDRLLASHSACGERLRQLIPVGLSDGKFSADR